MSTHYLDPRRRLDVILRYFKLSTDNEFIKLFDLTRYAIFSFINGSHHVNPKLLNVIETKTPFSVHWFLTGDGDRYDEEKIELLKDELLGQKYFKAEGTFMLTGGRAYLFPLYINPKPNKFEKRRIQNVDTWTVVRPEYHKAPLSTFFGLDERHSKTSVKPFLYVIRFLNQPAFDRCLHVHEGEFDEHTTFLINTKPTMWRDGQYYLYFEGERIAIRRIRNIKLRPENMEVIGMIEAYQNCVG